MLLRRFIAANIQLLNASKEVLKVVILKASKRCYIQVHTHHVSALGLDEGYQAVQKEKWLNRQNGRCGRRAGHHVVVNRPHVGRVVWRRRRRQQRGGAQL